MNAWSKRVRGAIGMGLTWAVGWGATGVLIGVASVLTPFFPWAPFFRVFDAPLPAMAVPGFFAGAFFSIVLGVAARRRRFAELSLARFTAWGAVGGLMLSLFPAAMVVAGMASMSAGAPGLLPLTAVIMGPLMLLSAASAAGTLLLARRAEHRDAIGGEPTRRPIPGSLPPA